MEYILLLNYRFIERDSVEKGTQTLLTEPDIANRNMVQTIRKHFRQKPSDQFCKISFEIYKRSQTRLFYISRNFTTKLCRELGDSSRKRKGSTKSCICTKLHAGTD